MKPLPSLVRRGSNQIENEFELIHFSLPREDGTTEYDFGKDTAGGPNVDGGAVACFAQEKFGGTVPEGDNLVGEFSFVGVACLEMKGKKVRVAN
jgi:hypothetical protein